MNFFRNHKKLVAILLIITSMGILGSLLFPPKAQAVVPLVAAAWPIISGALWTTGAVATAGLAVSIFTDCSIGDVFCGVKEAAKWLIYFITYAIGFIASWFIQLGANLIDFGIGLNNNILSPENFIVSKGFSITLALANLGFVLAIILIAFSTILRLEGYETKKLLRNLIIAAILINFSFVIIGTVLDLTGVFSNFFIKKSTPEDQGGVSSFALNIVNGLAPQRLLDGASKGLPIADTGIPPETLNLTEGDEEGSAFGDFMRTLANLVFVTIFTVVAALVMFAIAIMILVRYVYLSILIVLMPLAWLFWTIPQLSKYWNQWWDKFLQWTFFLPAVTFFLFLAIVTVTSPGTEKIPEGGEFFGSILQMILATGLLIGALIAGQSIGITGAGAALGMAKGVGRWTGKKMGGGTKATARGAARLADRAPGLAGALGIKRMKGATISGGLSKGLNKARFIPGAKSAVAGLEKMRNRKGEVEEYQKNYLSDLSEDRFNEVLKSKPVGATAKAAILAEAGKRKKLSKLADGDIDLSNPNKEAVSSQRNERLKAFAAAAKEMNPGTAPEDIESIKQILEANPHLAEALGIKSENGEDLVAKFTNKVPAGKASELSKDALGSIDVAINLSDTQISNVYRSGTTEKREKLRETLTNAASHGGLAEISRSITNLKQARITARETGNKDQEKKIGDDLARAYKERDEAKEILKNQIKDNSKDTDAVKAAERALKAFDRLQILEQRVADTEYYI